MHLKSSSRLAAPTEDGRGPIERLKLRLNQNGIDVAVLSHPETLAHLVGFEQPLEDWPVAMPLNACPPLLIVGLKQTTLLCPSLYMSQAKNSPVEVLELPAQQTYIPLQLQHLLRTQAAVIGIETRSLPVQIADYVRPLGLDLISVDQLLIDARRIKTQSEVEAVRQASHLADTVQIAVKEQARSGLLEVDLVAAAISAMYRRAGRRVPAVLSVTSGQASGQLGGIAGSRALEPGDLVLVDVSPWFCGAWSDSANTVSVGPPGPTELRMFDAVRDALELAIRLCRPGTKASDIDRQVRASLESWGPTYGHHTGHGVGASWWEPPFIVPDSEERIEEGMILAVEPAIYQPGWGGIRLESVFVVGGRQNELLTEFEHTL